MDPTTKKESLVTDSVRKLSDNIVTGAAVSIASAMILVVILGRVVDTRQLMLWLAGIVAIGLIRLVLWRRYKNNKYSGSAIHRYRTLLLATLAVTGMIWGSTAFWSFPPELITYQVFITFVLAGLVAGSVGIYSVMMSAYFYFSVPLLFPMAVRFFFDGVPCLLCHGNSASLLLGFHADCRPEAQRGYHRLH